MRRSAWPCTTRRTPSFRATPTGCRCGRTSTSTPCPTKCSSSRPRTRFRTCIARAGSSARPAAARAASRPMLKYTLHKLLIAALVAVTVSFVAFMLLRVSGDLATALGGEVARGEDIERVRVQLGLDRPLVSQYRDWASRAAIGAVAKSFYYPEA